jgi:hypothetical protein
MFGNTFLHKYRGWIFFFLYIFRAIIRGRHSSTSIHIDRDYIGDGHFSHTLHYTYLLLILCRYIIGNRYLITYTDKHLLQVVHLPWIKYTLSH